MSVSAFPYYLKEFAIIYGVVRKDTIKVIYRFLSAVFFFYGLDKEYYKVHFCSII